MDFEFLASVCVWLAVFGLLPLSGAMLALKQWRLLGLLLSLPPLGLVLWCGAIGLVEYQIVPTRYNVLGLAALFMLVLGVWAMLLALRALVKALAGKQPRAQ